MTKTADNIDRNGSTTGNSEVPEKAAQPFDDALNYPELFTVKQKSADKNVDKPDEAK